MTASLYHAQRILTAAVNAGFRESGVQSLKNLTDPNAFPMVAVRTTGLALESWVGVVDGCGETQQAMKCLVSAEYLEVLARLANERFEVNTERACRFEEQLPVNREQQRIREPAEIRKERKRREGLEHQALLMRNGSCASFNDCKVKAEI